MNDKMGEQNRKQQNKTLVQWHTLSKAFPKDVFTITLH